MGGDEGEEGGVQCSEHPYRRSNPGGICAVCLQEKLGKLVSSSKSNHPFSFPTIPPPRPLISSSSSSSASASASASSCEGGTGRGGGGNTVAASASASASSVARRTKIPPFLSAASIQYRRKRKKKKKAAASSPRAVDGNSNSSSVALKRSKSVAPRPSGGLPESMESPRIKKSFWSFLSLTSSSSSSSFSSANKGRSSSSSGEGAGLASDSQQQQAPRDGTQRSRRCETGQAEEAEEESPNGSQASSSFGRKVARSRSVGCGSRSFSGDFLERISTGFGDCTLRRVESQREAKPKTRQQQQQQQHQGIKERVRCGGIFGGLGMISSSSSYWLSAAESSYNDLTSSSNSSSRVGVVGGSTPHGRSRSWGWAFASPMRAFRHPSASKPYSIAAAGGAATATATTASINNVITIDASTVQSTAPSATSSYII